MTLNYQKIKLTTAIIMIGTVFFLFFSFNSHWAYGNIDQSEIFQNSITQSNTQNILGFTGAKISYFFISLFGISAYLIISLILLFTIKALFKTQKINIINTLIQHLFLIIWISLFCAQLKNITLGGKIGLFMTNALLPLVGHFGITLTLTISILIFVTIFLNIKLELIIKFIHLIREKLKLFQKTREILDEEEEILQSNSNQNVNKDNSQNEELHTIVALAKNENIVTENKILEKDSKNIQVEYKFPDLDLLKEYPENKISINEKEVESNKKLIEETLRDFKIDVKIKRATIGPTITLYEIVPDEGVRISKIKNLENDIALRIKAIGVRIIAPLPGKGTVGIEVPNQNPTIVSMKNVMESARFQNAKLELPIAIGKTISNETFVMDLTKMPHLLIAGATGQGKSVGLNTILCSILYKKHPSEVKFILVDPKKVELTLYNKIEKHFLAKIPGDNEAIITDTKQVINTLKSLCLEMDRRYELLKKAEVRNIQEYNQKYKSNQELGENNFLPYLILVIDEFADLIMTAGKEIEIPIARLAQLSRAIGIHLIIATQRPTTNIITGTIKANFPTRIAFRVIQGIDSKTILDTVGANQLIGRGDMLISDGSNLSRIQCAFIDTPEVEKLTNFIGQQEGFQTSFELPTTNSEPDNIKIENKDERDPLFKDAALLIIMHQQGSTSMIQRKLKLGYNRAGRIIDQLEAAGIIGPLEGSKGRKVLIETEEELNQII